MKDDKEKDDIVYEEESKKDTKTSDESDIVPEEEDASPQVLIKKLKDKIKVLEKERQEYLDGWQRERADFANFKKRSESERAETIKYANENLVADLLSVLESFDMAFSNKEAWEKVDKNWRVGVEYIHSQFMKILSDNGLSILDPKAGDTFDPAVHVASETLAVAEKDKDSKILSVKKIGYSLNGRIIIAPKVVVGEFNENK